MRNTPNNWHFARPKLAKTYLDLFELGLTSARGLFARRRMGKTEFLKKDLIPEAIARGYRVVYTNLWDLEIDPATALIAEFYKAVEPKGFKKIVSQFNFPIKKLKASGKISGFAEGTIETDLKDNKRVTGTLLMEAMNAFDRTKMQLMLVIDEAQVLAYEENAHFAHALRAALDVRKERIKVIFAGSSETTLRKMFGVPSEPFYNWAPLEPFELLGDEFVAAMVAEVKSISKYPLALNHALEAFQQLKNTPEFFRRYIEYYVTHPTEGSLSALNATKEKVFSDIGFKQQWDELLPADKVMLLMIAEKRADLCGKIAMQRLDDELGLEGGANRNTTQNALRRLTNKNIISKIAHGNYQFEDEAFEDWVKYRE